MVVLAAAITSNGGRALLSRQFVDISRGRIEGLLAAFPKLMGKDSQHTYIETDTVRYVYQPLESLFMVIITNKASNILEDLHTLHLLAKVVPEYCRHLDERGIVSRAFELIFAFDEVIAGGYKEKVTMQQIKTFMEMDSHEEKVHEMVARNQEREAAEEAKRRRHQIERMRSEAAARGTSFDSRRSAAASSWNAGPSHFSHSSGPEPFVVKKETRESSRGPPRGGMVLKPQEDTNRFLKELVKEETPRGRTGQAATVVTEEGAVSVSATTERVEVAMVEHLQASLENNGPATINTRGDMTITINDPACVTAALKLRTSDHPGFQFRTHPKIDKTLWTDKAVVALKDPSKPFKAGSPLHVLKWRFSSSDDKLLPLTISCWPNDGGDGTTVVTLEYEAREGAVLSDVRIAVPILTRAPTVTDADGSYEFDSKNHVLMWRFDLIDSQNSSGSMEFVVPSISDNSNLFPISVGFSTTRVFCELDVLAVRTPEGEDVKFNQVKSLLVDEYSVTYGGGDDF